MSRAWETWETRAARPEDYLHFVRLFPELGVAEPPPTESMWLKSFLGGSLFVDDGDVRAGYARYDILRTCGYVRNIIVDSDYRRQGIGKALMDGCRQRFLNANCTEWRLNVVIDNQPAICLYKDCGFAPLYRSTALVFPVDAVANLPDAPASIRVQPLLETRDSAVEARFGMPDGLLTSLRAHVGDSLLQLVDDSRSPPACVGVARFSPHVPGAFPFRLEWSDIMRPFIEAMLEMTPEGTEAIYLTCEADPELTEELVRAGARVLMQLFHMRGHLP